MDAKGDTGIITLLLRLIISIWKLLAVVMSVLLFIIVSLPLYPYYLVSPYNSKKVLNRIVSFCSRLMIYFLNIRIKSTGFENNNQTGLYICNHLSYLDIFILSSIYPSSYITSKEMKEAPILGQITQLAGCVFVERRNKTERQRELLDVASTLRSGVSITLFPEATSTNGDFVKQFKKPMYVPAYENRIPIIMLCLNYQMVNQEKINRSNRDLVLWYGGQSFFNQFLKLVFKVSCLEVSVSSLGVINSADFNTLDDLVSYTHMKITENFEAINS